MPRTSPTRLVRSPVRYLAFVVVLSSFGALGCPGSLDPSLLPSGGAGSGGGNGACDAPNLIFNQSPSTGCVVPGLCHGDQPLAPGGLNLTPDSGLVTRLLDVMPNGTNSSMCGDIGKAYLIRGSDPPQGLLLDKIMPTVPCGQPMPTLGSLTPSDIQCITEWAASVTKP